MTQTSSSTREIIEQVVKQSGITKKLAAGILHAIPDVIEEGLKKDGEVRVKGLGTFRLRWTRGKVGRNPKTGERVEVPSHNRVVFIPEQAFKEYINRDNRLLSYKIIPYAEKEPTIEEIIPESKIIGQYQEQYQDQPQPQPEPVAEPESIKFAEPGPERITDPESESESAPGIIPPTRKSRIHWIVPVAISVIIILSLVFYFRTSRQSAVSDQQSAVGGQQVAVGSQQSAVGGQQVAVGSQQSAVGSQQSAVSDQQAAVGGQQVPVGSQQSAVGGQQEIEPIPKSEIPSERLKSFSRAGSNPKSELKTKNLNFKTIPEGTRLFQLAREIYGNPYLWVLIYKENLDKIPDPDMVVSGNELLIPALEGKDDRLSTNDSMAVSEGYRLVYEFYLAKDDIKARDFALAMKRYKPK